MTKRDKKGWLAVLGCSLGIFWSGPLVFAFPGLLGPDWCVMFSVGPAETGRIITFVLFSLGIFSFLSGKWHLRLGTRGAFLAGTLLMLASLVLLRFAQNIWMVYLWAFLNGTAATFFYGPGLATVQLWFPQRRGFVTGLLNLVFGLSAAVMAPALYWMLHNLGYLNMLYVVMGMVAAVNAASILLSETPERSCLSEAERVEHAELLAQLAARQAALSNRPHAHVNFPEFTPKQAMRTRYFWYLWLCLVFMGAAGISMVGLSVSYSESVGLAGVAVLTAFNLTNGLSRIVAGVLSDVIGGALTGALSFVLAAVGYFSLIGSESLFAVALFASFVGFAFGAMFAVMAPLVAELFGLKYFAAVFGLTFTAYGFVGGILGPALAGQVLDWSGGDYTPVFIYLGVFSLLAAPAILAASPRKVRQARL